MKAASAPPTASWTHRGVRHGFEVLFIRRAGPGFRLRGCTAAREGTQLWAVDYDIHVDAGWNTLSTRATVTGPVETGLVSLARSAENRWSVNGVLRPDLDGCVDVDFESSGATNTLPIHRLNFDVGETMSVPAAFVRVDGGRVERLEQRYTLSGMSGDGMTVRYESSTFDVTCVLEFDRSGLILEYPGIAVRDS